MGVLCIARVLRCVSVPIGRAKPALRQDYFSGVIIERYVLSVVMTNNRVVTKDDGVDLIFGPALSDGNQLWL